MTEPITEEALRRKLLAADRTSEEKLLGAHGSHPELLAWAEQHGYEITGHIFENGISGATPILLRDQLIQAIWQVRDDPTYAGIIIPSTERLGRDQATFDDLRYAMSWIGKHLYVGIHDHTGHLTDIQDIAGPEHITERHERQIRELRATIGRTELLFDALRARKAKIDRKGYGGGWLKPAWFQDRIALPGGGVEFAPNPQRLQWALWARERQAEGWSRGRIARELNHLGVLTKAGNDWSRFTIRDLLSQLDTVPDDILSVWLHREIAKDPTHAARAPRASVA